MHSLNGDVGNGDVATVAESKHESGGDEDDPRTVLPLETEVSQDDVVLAEESAVDDALVQEAYNKLENIVVQHFTKTMEDVGRYLIKKFYGNDLERARNGKPVKVKSLNQLIKKLHQNNGNAPSRTWIYDSVKLAADTGYFNQEKFEEYGKIGHSHKVCLTHVNDVETKKTLVKETVDNKYSVAKLKERIAEEKGIIPVMTLGMLPDKKILKEKSIVELEGIAERADGDIKKLNDRLGKYNSALEVLNAVIAEKKQSRAE